MIDFIRKESYDFGDLVRLVTVLRAPGGCPWDGVQTHLSIRRNFLEEAYEACEGFDADDPDIMLEELGDVLLQVLFHTDIEREAGRFTLDDVCDRVCKKLVFRHPKLFGNENAPDWDEMKKLEKGQTSVSETMKGVAKSLPSLWRAEKLRKKALKSGAEPESIEETLDKLEMAVKALRKAAAANEGVEDALGSTLFLCAVSAATLEADPEQALHSACDRYIDAFAQQEADSGAVSE